MMGLKESDRNVMVEIPAGMLYDLMANTAKIEALAVYANATRYSLNRGDVAKIMGFELEKADEG